MSTVGLFVAGTLVSLLVAGSMALLVWGAILDGRYEREHRLAEEARTAGHSTIRVVDAA
jgi:hypothetical protein